MTLRAVIVAGALVVALLPATATASASTTTCTYHSATRTLSVDTDVDQEGDVANDWLAIRRDGDRIVPKVQTGMWDPDRKDDGSWYTSAEVVCDGSSSVNDVDHVAVTAGGGTQQPLVQLDLRGGQFRSGGRGITFGIAMSPDRDEGLNVHVSSVVVTGHALDANHIVAGQDRRGRVRLNLDGDDDADVLTRFLPALDGAEHEFRLTVVGGGGADVLRTDGGFGTGLPLRSPTRSGPDIAYRPLLMGGDGADVLRAGRAHETLVGGKGADRLYGGAGGDVLFGGSGADVLRGRAAHDLLFGGAGDDALYGGPGPDYFGKWYALDDDSEDLGRDRVYGGSGNDRMDGHGGDRLWGGAGSDHLVNVAGRNVLRGGKGNDRLDSYSTGSVLSGGPGVDTVAFKTLGGPVTASIDGQANDGVQGRPKDNVQRSVERLVGTPFDDRLTGTTGTAGVRNVLVGRAGHDVLKGLDGNDVLRGGSGRDLLRGGAGFDTCKGGPGRDTFSSCERRR